MRTRLLVAALVLLPTRALAAQFVVTEVTYEHSATTTTDSHLRLPPSAETPKNWKSPIDYATAGTVYVRLEVFTKPSTANTRFQVCFEATPSYACTNQSPIYTTPGVYTWATPFPSFYQYDKVDWTKGILKSALILKDDKNVKPAPENVGAERSALFMPTKVRVTVTVVSPGSTYVPPPETGSDAGADVAVDALVADTMVEDTATADTAGPAEDAALAADATPPVEATATDLEGGCALSRRSSRSTLLPFALALAGASLLRRRARG